MTQTLQPDDALIVVDVQNDFCPGGALPIENADAVIPVLNRWIADAASAGVPVFASRDWHPAGHMSFAENGGPWPPHCIQDSDGAQFHPDLALQDTAVIVTKGVRFDQDQNSAFDETGLAVKLRADGITRLFIGGLAEDVCVLATALDARKNGFAVKLITDATLPVTPEGGSDARKKMQDAGVQIFNSKSV
ncbi:MAG TPA: nicotinamidase [Desulfotignum sp.]|nr:nicotinamidase [Desulfotignum sp.]